MRPVQLNPDRPSIMDSSSRIWRQERVPSTVLPRTTLVAPALQTLWLTVASDFRPLVILGEANDDFPPLFCVCGVGVCPLS
mmetsp:Transcript_20228/g.29233  ORF Transcript_20228/g.29233 Transcript_20228/m.29233 type:complete len:81 (+) Transcript_20228:241-483(+)